MGATVTYTNENGESATAIVVGEPVTSIEARQDKIVERNNLKEKARQTQ